MFSWPCLCYYCSSNPWCPPGHHSPAGGRWVCPQILVVYYKVAGGQCDQISDQTWPNNSLTCLLNIQTICRPANQQNKQPISCLTNRPSSLTSWHPDDVEHNAPSDTMTRSLMVTGTLTKSTRSFSRTQMNSLLLGRFTITCEKLFENQFEKRENITVNFKFTI